MKQRIKIVGSVFLSFALVAALIRSYRRQSEMEQQLSEVKRRWIAARLTRNATRHRRRMSHRRHRLFWTVRQPVQIQPVESAIWKRF